MNNAVAIIEKVKQKQAELGVNDSEFARETLLIPRTTWIQSKSFVRPIGLAIIRAIARAFPDMESQILAFIRGEQS